MQFRCRKFTSYYKKVDVDFFWMGVGVLLAFGEACMFALRYYGMVLEGSVVGRGRVV